MDGRTRKVLLLTLAMPAAAAAAPGRDADHAATGTRYMAVFIDGHKAGYARHTRTVSNGKITTEVFTSLVLKRASVELGVSTRETAVETVKGEPLRFEFVQKAGPMAQSTEGRIGEDGKLHLTVSPGGQKRNPTKRWPKGALLFEGMRLLELRKGLKPGTTYQAKVFLISEAKALEVRVRVGKRREVDLLGRVRRLSEVRQTLSMAMGDVQVTTFVDSDGEALKQMTSIYGIRMEMVACGKQYALSENDPQDFLAALLVDSPKPLEEARKARSITYTLAPEDGAKLKFPDVANQSVQQRGGKVLLTVQRAEAPEGASFPYKGDDEEALGALKANRYLQSDHEAIARLAKEAVGDAGDAATAARRIEAFVRNYISKKDLSVGYASALEVARSRQGDCSEHAVLGAALCRAAGVPARVVTGLVYVGDFAGRRQTFGPHAWYEARIGGAWVGYDAGLDGFDPTHIAVSVGDGSPEQFFQGLGTLGHFRIESVRTGR